MSDSDKKTLNFVCACGSNEFEEVVRGVIVTSQVIGFYDHCDLAYGKQSNEEGEVLRYQCTKCGKEILNKDGERAVYPEEIIEMFSQNDPAAG